MFRFQLGVKLRDRITGFEGRATASCAYITGCDQYLIQPQTKEDGSWVDARWFDDNRLELVDSTAVTLETLEDKKTGPCEPAPIK